MKPAASLDTFVRNPVGTWIQRGSSVTWCVSPSLVGSTVWGSPDVAATRAILEAFEGLWAEAMNDRVDVLFDARRVERVDPSALGVVLSWNVDRREAILRRVRLQISVVRTGPVAVMLSGVLPLVGETHPFRIVHALDEGFRAVAGEHGDALAAEVEAIVEAATTLPEELRATRSHLRRHLSDATLATTARAIGTSSRSLQRALAAAGTTFQEELQTARFERACELLQSTDTKIVAVAAEVGLSERGLSGLFHDRVGRSPARYRSEGRG